MGIYKKGENWYIDYYVGGRRKREKVGKNRKLAISVLNKRETQIVENKFLDIKRDEKIKFGDMASLYLKTYSSITNKPSTYKRNLKIIKNLNRCFGGMYIYEINALSIEKYKKERANQVKLDTINRELALLRAILNKAKEWGKLQTSVPQIKLFKVDNKRVRYLLPEEEKMLLNECPEPLKSIVIIALNTGMRKGEILSLKWQDIDIKEKFITLTDTKNREKRYVPINETVIDTLIRLDKNPNSEYLFPGINNSSHIDESYISHKFKGIVNKLGIKDFRFHDLRHCFASKLVMRGIPLNTVQELLGHKDYKMTQRYSHLSPDHKKYAVEILDEKDKKGIGLDTIWTPEENKEKANTT